MPVNKGPAKICGWELKTGLFPFSHPALTPKHFLQCPAPLVDGLGPERLEACAWAELLVWTRVSSSQELSPHVRT